MGRITSIYLTDKESAELERFCEENQCTQYSALKIALRELLCRSTHEEDTAQTEREESTKTNQDSNEEKPSIVSRLVSYLKQSK